MFDYYVIVFDVVGGAEEIGKAASETPGQQQKFFSSCRSQHLFEVVVKLQTSFVG